MYIDQLWEFREGLVWSRPVTATFKSPLLLISGSHGGPMLWARIVGKSTFCIKCFLSISNFSSIFFMLIDLSFKQAEMIVSINGNHHHYKPTGAHHNFYEGYKVFSLIKSNFQVYKYNTDVLHILFLWAFLLMPMTCATVSLKTVLFIFIKISSSHLNLFAIFCVYLTTGNPALSHIIA